MGNWGADHHVQGLNMGLESAVSLLNPKAKKAIYGAARAKTIHQRTWDGCAFNAGGIEIGSGYITSYNQAAEIFGLPYSSVKRFIEVWDALSGTEEENTQKLIDTIEKVGLFTEPGEKRPPRIYRTTVEISKENAMVAELHKELDSGTVLEGMQEAGNLLFASV